MSAQLNVQSVIPTLIKLVEGTGKTGRTREDVYSVLLMGFPKYERSWTTPTSAGRQHAEGRFTIVLRPTKTE